MITDFQNTLVIENSISKSSDPTTPAETDPRILPVEDLELSGSQ